MSENSNLLAAAERAERSLARLVDWHADALKAVRFDRRARPSGSSTKTSTIRGAKSSTKSESSELLSQPYPGEGKKRAELERFRRAGDTAGLLRFAREQDKEYARLGKHRLPPLDATQRLYWKNQVSFDTMITSVPKAPRQTERVTRALELRAEGKSLQAIADEFGVTRQAVHNWVKGALKGERERKLPV